MRSVEFFSDEEVLKNIFGNNSNAGTLASRNKMRSDFKMHMDEDKVHDVWGYGNT